MARIANTKEQYRTLFAKTGNQCAFPGCHHPLIDDDNVFVAQVCHIEAAQPGGPRYNPEMTDEDRRSVDNLMVMCYRHHKTTDNTEAYSASRLQRMKTEHESKWAERLYALPEQALDKVIEEQMQFEGQVARVNARWVTSFDLAMHFRFHDDPAVHLNEICDSVSGIGSLLEDISGFLAKLQTDIGSLLDKLGYDSTAYRRLSYYENPFENVFWERLALGLPNSLKTILFHSKALEAHLCFQRLRMHPNDSETRDKLDELKLQLSELASRSILHD